MIIPSYKEDVRINRTTMLSAALQDYPALRVVLLIDDPANPTRKKDRDLLEAARGIATGLQELLDEPSQRFTAAMKVFEARGKDFPLELSDMSHAAEHYDAAAAWMNKLADDTEIVDHTDTFFVDVVLRRMAADFTSTGDAIRGAIEDGVVLPFGRLLELYQRLAWTFTVDLSSFERKQYVSLSHEANKAMNLNSYIGLMGGTYRDTVTVSGRELVPARPGMGDLEIPDPDYVLTLDADSILLPEYCLRLVHLMEQSEHADVAVAQTPYSAFPGSSTRLERIAGATTDLQYIAHQGMTYYGATFWVGANAVLRKRALDEVRESTFVGSWEIRRYIQDRTVIEDTESTIDLRLKDWSLLNYPERLAYSATPPDFGSLCIQRRRWANGGILILPKLWRTRKARAARGEANKISETFIRVNYMASVAWSSISLLLLLAYPFDNQLISPLLGLIALPYFIGMASDLKYCGYKRTDVLRIYGFNLILMPVNLAGFCNSLVQALTGEKSVFGRTPKVANRTVPDFLFVISPYLLTGLAGWTLWQDWTYHRYVNLFYAVAEHHAGLLRDRRLHRPARLDRRLLDARQGLAVGPGRAGGPQAEPLADRGPQAGAGRRHVHQTTASADWASVLHFGSAEWSTAGQAGRHRRHAPAPAQGARPGTRLRAPFRSAPRTRRSARSSSRSSSSTVATSPDAKRSPASMTASPPTSGSPKNQRRGNGLELEILLARASVQAAADFPQRRVARPERLGRADPGRAGAERHRRAGPPARSSWRSTPARWSIPRKCVDIAGRHAGGQQPRHHRGRSELRLPQSRPRAATGFREAGPQLGARRAVRPGSHRTHPRSGGPGG